MNIENITQQIGDGGGGPLILTLGVIAGSIAFALIIAKLLSKTQGSLEESFAVGFGGLAAVIVITASIAVIGGFVSQAKEQSVRAELEQQFEEHYGIHYTATEESIIEQLESKKDGQVFSVGVPITRNGELITVKLVAEGETKLVAYYTTDEAEVLTPLPASR